MAEKVAANKAQYHFFCGDIEKRTFEVAEFTGCEHISAPYNFTITLVSQVPDISPDTVIGHPASLYILRKGKYHPYSGVINEFQLIDKSVDYCIYRAELVPRIWMASLNYQTRIFQKTTISNIIKTVLNDANVQNVQISIQNDPEHEYIVQYQESDLNFISRLMEENGIWYFFKEEAKEIDPVESSESGLISEEVLYIVDAPQDFEDIPGTSSDVVFRSSSGMYERDSGDVYESITQVQYEKVITPKEVFVKNYNYRSPEDDLVGRKPVTNGIKGTVYEYGGMFKTSPEADTAATILSKRIQSRQISLQGAGDCRAFKVGYRFVLKDHFRTDVCQPYVVTSVTHSGGNFSGRESLTYSNRFSAIPMDIANQFAPEKTSIITRVNGVMSAHIEANNADYATIDDKGRYKVRLPYDLVGKKNDCTGSKYVRLAQPYSGAQYGIHFPSHQGTEMVLACIDGDPNKPVGIGTVPNANTISPVVESNKQQNLIRTAGGNELLMDDTDAKQVVQLRTNGQNVLKMDDENKRITVQSTDKNIITIDDTNSVIQILSSKHLISLSYADDSGILITTEGNNVINLDDTNKKITVQTGGGHQIEMDDNGKKIVLADGQGKNTVTLDGSKGIILDTTGKLSINATQDIEIKGANIKMSASTGKIDIKATQDLSLAGLNINEKANVAVKIEGVQLEAKGSATVKVQGAMTEIKGDATIKVSGGAMAEVSGGGMTTIKGGIVMIN
jgi:type VI secretion system secreted protein VgrG